MMSQRFLWTWSIAVMIFAAVLASFDAIVDPYLMFNIPRIKGFNARKPAAVENLLMVKAYDVLRAKPQSLLLGSSRIAQGLDAEYSGWPTHDAPIYNLGINGASPYIFYRYLQHVMAQRHLTLVVLGLDFETALSNAVSAPGGEELELRLASTRDGSANPVQKWQYVRDLARATLSVDAFVDGAATLSANLSSNSFDFGPAGNITLGPAPFDTSTVFRDRNSWHIVQFHDKPISRLPLADVKAILQLCKSHGTRVVAFINPTHADELEIIDLLGYWASFEEWKRELVALMAQANVGGHSNVVLWDFSDYDSYSTEHVSLASQDLHWFSDPLHYKRALGNEIIKRIFGAGDAHFGTLLRPENVESHLLAIREQRRLYRERSEVEVRRVRDLYDLVAATQSWEPRRMQ